MAFATKEKRGSVCLRFGYNIQNLLFVIGVPIDRKDLAAEPRGTRGWMQQGCFIPSGDARKIDGLGLSHGCHSVLCVYSTVLVF